MSENFENFEFLNPKCQENLRLSKIALYLNMFNSKAFPFWLCVLFLTQTESNAHRSTALFHFVRFALSSLPSPCICFDTFEFVSDAPPTLFVIMLFLACARYYLLKICHRIEISWIPPLWRFLYEYCLNSLSYTRAYLRNDAIISSTNNIPHFAGVIPSSQTTSHQKHDVSFDLSFAF